MGKQAKRIRDDGDVEVFAKPMADGSWAVGLLNRNDLVEQNISISRNEVGAEGKMKVRDLWKHQDFNEFSDFSQVALKPHQCAVVRIHRNIWL